MTDYPTQNSLQISKNDLGVFAVCQPRPLKVDCVHVALLENMDVFQCDKRYQADKQRDFCFRRAEPTRRMMTPAEKAKIEDQGNEEECELTGCKRRTRLITN